MEFRTSLSYEEVKDMDDFDSSTYDTIDLGLTNRTHRPFKVLMDAAVESIVHD